MADSFGHLFVYIILLKPYSEVLTLEHRMQSPVYLSTLLADGYRLWLREKRGVSDSLFVLFDDYVFVAMMRKLLASPFVALFVACLCSCQLIWNQKPNLSVEKSDLLIVSGVKSIADSVYIVSGRKYSLCIRDHKDQNWSVSVIGGRSGIWFGLGCWDDPKNGSTLDLDTMPGFRDSLFMTLAGINVSAVARLNYALSQPDMFFRRESLNIFGPKDEWAFDTNTIFADRQAERYAGIVPKWNGKSVGLSSFIMDSRFYSRVAVHSFYDPHYLERPYCQALLGKPWNYLKFLDRKYFWWEFGDIEFQRVGNHRGVSSGCLCGDSTKKFQIKNLDLSRSLVEDCDSFFVSPKALGYSLGVSFDGAVGRANAVELKYLVVRRGSGMLFGKLWWRKKANHSLVSDWSMIPDSVQSVVPYDDCEFAFIRGEDSLWGVSEQFPVDKIKTFLGAISVSLKYPMFGVILPRNSHWSCLADSLGGWEYEACGDHPAPPILKHNGKPVSQKVTPQITPWGKMSWETRGSRIGWFLPPGQRFLPRVFRTEKAPLVDDFWATPPKGVP